MELGSGTKDFNNLAYTLLHHFFGAGVYEEIWKRKEMKETPADSLPQVGPEMEELYQRLRLVKRTEFPIFLDPQKASFTDVGIHAKLRQYLANTTIEKHLRYARFMQHHRTPVDFRNPTPENFLRHIDARIEEGATPNALKHEKKAIIMFLRAYNLYSRTWDKVVKTPPVNDNQAAIEIPFPGTVNQLYHATYSRNPYENTLLQTIVFTGFNFGMRPPSEICNLDTQDIHINTDDTGYIRIHETKKNGRTRIIYPFNKTVLSAPVYKTPLNYLQNWRWKAENHRSGDALFLRPDGTRITGSYLRRKITPLGKHIAGNNFHLYTMRHTCATYLYEYTHDLQTVKDRLGHTKITTTQRYIHIADNIKNQLHCNTKRNLFNIALRYMAAQKGMSDALNRTKKNRHSTSFTSGGERWARQDSSPPTGNKKVDCHRLSSLLPPFFISTHNGPKLANFFRVLSSNFMSPSLGPASHTLDGKPRKQTRNTQPLDKPIHLMDCWGNHSSFELSAKMPPPIFAPQSTSNMERTSKPSYSSISPSLVLSSSPYQSHNLNSDNREKMKTKSILTTTSILAGLIAILATAQVGDGDGQEVKVAGFQFTTLLDDGNPSYYHKISFSGGNIYDLLGYGGYSDIFGGDCISVGLGQGAHATSGTAGTLCLQIDEPGTYTLGIDPTSHVFGDCDALPLDNPVILPTGTITVNPCEQEPPIGDEITLTWIDLPDTVCAGEEFCFDVGIEIPAATESKQFFCQNANNKKQYGEKENEMRDMWKHSK